MRPAYKWVHSPRFPSGLKWYPQTYIDNRGEERTIPRYFTCPHYIIKNDPVLGAQVLSIKRETREKIILEVRAKECQRYGFRYDHD